MSLADSANETAQQGNNCQLSFLLFEYDLLENLNTQWNPENNLYFSCFGTVEAKYYSIYLNIYLGYFTISLNLYGLYS